MSEADIASFMGITFSTRQQATQFLEMANGNLENAINLYYQNPNAAPQQRPQPPQRPQPTQRPRPPVTTDTKTLIDDIFTHAQNQQDAPPEQFDAGDDKVEKIKVTFWKNGFQVEDGDFRPNDDPANQEFLQAVSRGMIPRELMKPGVQLDVEIDDQRDSDYKEKPKPFNPFGGKSRTLNTGAPQAAAPKPNPAPMKQQVTNFANAGQPSTKVRLQLSDQLLIFTVSLSATVGNLRGYILQNRPDLRGRKLKFMLTYPPQPLDDDNLTIEQGKLKMAQINVQVI